MPLLRSGSFRIFLLLLCGVLLPLLWPGLLPNLWNTSGFAAEHHETWPAALVALHVGSDLLVWLSYTVIALLLALLVYRNRAHLPFDWVVLAFGLFIVACGFTHVMHVVVRFVPVYWFDAYVRALTAIVSVATAAALPPLMPRVSQALRATAELQRKEQELQQALRVNTALLNIVQLAQERRPALEVAEHVLLQFQGALDVDWLGLSVHDGAAPQVRQVWHSPRVSGPLLHAPPLENGQSLAALATETQRSVFVDDYAAHPRAHPLYLQAGVASAALVPLGSGSGALVLMAAKVGDNRGWADWERQLFEAARVSVNVALERQSHLRQLESAALQDALTGLNNRRAFETDLNSLVAREQPFGVIMMDLDGLKAVNDALGHEAGDQLLRLFGQGLRSHMRAGDRCYRLGGDEFAVLLSHGQPGVEGVLYGRIRSVMTQVQAQGFAQADVSAGIAFFPHEGAGAESLLRLADQRMYAMKALHRRPRPGEDPTLN
ncbi:GGDEF domain-containing protein [Deinococcus aquaedulcis]|uniref:GGDEF domain-containing protein n=1 Tax=Deinococcus aquaedulcis TaxID=2840455 RepID=UPI001C82C901|nr:GGDEF domain-containing protein [Deinococcus aquaedulcis]